MMEKIELHLHTIGRSPCALVEPKDIPALYLAKGYTGIVVTNHYMKWLFDEYYPAGTFTQKLNYYLQGYRDLKRYGEDAGLKVFLGLELNLERYNQEKRHPAYEFLSYGVTEDFLLEYPELYLLSQQELFELYNKHGIVMVQAHPFRTRAYCSDFRYLHGVEVFNGNPRHNSFDRIAKTFAEEHHLIETCGSDFHEVGDEARGGVVFDGEVDSVRDIAGQLKSGTYRLSCGTETKSL